MKKITNLETKDFALGFLLGTCICLLSYILLEKPENNFKNNLEIDDSYAIIKK